MLDLYSNDRYITTRLHNKPYLWRVWGLDLPSIYTFTKHKFQSKNNVMNAVDSGKKMSVLMVFVVDWSGC